MGILVCFIIPLGIRKKFLGGLEMISCIKAVKTSGSGCVDHQLFVLEFLTCHYNSSVTFKNIF